MAVAAIIMVTNNELTESTLTTDAMSEAATASEDNTSGKMGFSIITYCNFFFVRIHKCLNKSSSLVLENITLDF